MAAMPKAVASQLVPSASIPTEARVKTQENTNASRGDTSPVTNGRLTVRFIYRSISRSIYQLNEPEAPADNALPTIVANTVHSSGQPRYAKIMFGSVVTKSNSITRGFVSAR